MFYKPERQYEPSIESYEQKKPLVIDYSGKREWQTIIQKLNLNPELLGHPELASPHEIAAITREGRKLEAKEMLLDTKDIFEIEEEINALFENKNFSIPFGVIKEMIPIHQYFSYLGDAGKATREDERHYFEYRYGWAEHPDFDFHSWDNKLATLNNLLRAQVCGLLSLQEVVGYVNNL